MDSADEMIARSLRGGLSSAEQKELAAWRQAAPRNETRYAQLVAMLRAVEAADAEAAPHFTPTSDGIIALAEHEGSARSGRSARRGTWIVRLAAAAAIVFALVSVPFVVWQLLDRNVPFRMGFGEYMSGPNETTTATLSDGTIVRLAPNSRLRVIDAAGRREVFLSGRAFLAVQPMENVPFHVRTHLGDVSVLGTRFDVHAGEVLRVAVVEGRVALSSARERIEIPAGKMSLATESGLTTPVEVDVRSLTSWVGRFLAFQETPLRDVAEELEAEYGGSVTIAAPELGDVTVTGAFIDRSFEEVVMIVCTVVGASCSVNGPDATIGR